MAHPSTSRSRSKLRPCRSSSSDSPDGLLSQSADALSPSTHTVHDSNASGNVDVMVNRSLGTLDRLETMMPDYLRGYEADVRHSRANLYYELGYARLREGRRASAREALIRAFKLRPFHVATAKELLRSLLPVPTV